MKFQYILNRFKFVEIYLLRLSSLRVGMKSNFVLFRQTELDLLLE
jgi:hypothetical protein